MRYIFLFFGLIICSVALAQPVQDYHYLDKYAHPQKSNFNAHINVGFAAINGNNYTLGDFAQQNYFLNPYISLGLGYQITHHMTALARTTYYRMRGSDHSDLGAGGVVSNNFGAVLALKHSLFPLKDFDDLSRDLNFYALAGGGLLYINPKNADSGEGFNAKPDFNKLTYMIPLGIGAEYRLSAFFSMALEVTYNFTGTDYLDAAVSPSNSRNDKFATLGVSTTYRIPQKSYRYDNFLKMKY